MIKVKKYDFCIGIDTGVNTGFAIWKPAEKKFVSIDTLMIHVALSTIQIFWENPFKNVLVRVEDARQRKWFGPNSNSKLQGAGSVKRDAKIWEDFLKDMSIGQPNLDYEMVAPKNNMTKINAEYFKKVTGWEKQTSEHARDAAMLVYGL